MTLLYVEVTQQDLQREYQAAQSHPRHLVPLPPGLRADATAGPVNAPAVEEALNSALRLLDLYRQLPTLSGPQKELLRLSRRLIRIRTLFSKLFPKAHDEK